MTSETLISGVTFPNSIVRAMPPIPGLRSMAFFGSGFDGNNSNRVQGGPPLVAGGTITPQILSDHTSVNLGTNIRAAVTATINAGAVTGFTITTPGTGYTTPPRISIGGPGTGASATAVIGGGAVTGFTNIVGGTGYVSVPTVGLLGGNLACWRTGVTRASQLAGGWSWAVVARNATADPQVAAVLSDQVGVSILGIITSMSLINSDPSFSNRPYARIHQNASISVPLQLVTGTLGTYHFLASTYSGGGSGTFNLYDLTDGLIATPVTVSGVTAGGNQEVTVGLYGDNLTTAGPSMNPYTVDVPWFMVADGVLSLASFQNIYASVKSQLARRGITC